MKNNDEINEEYKESLKKKIRNKLKKELIEEIYQELKAEENEISDEVSDTIHKKMVKESTEIKEPTYKSEKEEPLKPNKELKEKISISVKAILKIASHALKYAHSKIPREKWIEVIGLLAGNIDSDKNILYIEDAYPMGHGSAIYAEIKDYKNYAKAFYDIKQNNSFICGWYHSHPSYGTFMSTEDLGTQSRYQKLWNKAIALVIDPYQIDGTSLGFEIFKADIKTNKWFSIPFKVKGDLDIRMLPEILAFMNPIIEGKAAYLEYDEDK